MLFMDFCSGIGGGRLGLESNGLKCIAHSEISENAEKLYGIFFGNQDKNYGNLTLINVEELPDFDMLICGFPCQTFSIAGKRMGFHDSRGQIIFHITDILKKKKIPFFILENVKGLVNHNKGKTIIQIIDMLENCGYHVEYQILNSENYGVPQMRERVYIIGIQEDICQKKIKWNKKKSSANLVDFLDENNNLFMNDNDPTFLRYINNKYNKGKYSIDELLSKELRVIDWRQSDLRIYENKIPTLRNGRHGIIYVRNGKFHKLSGYEALLLQGFPRKVAGKISESGLSNNTVLSLAGNSMTVPVINEVCKTILNSIKDGEI